MKKGCFYFVITIFTILVALGYYVYKQNESFLSKIGKEKLISISINELNNKIDKNIRLSYKDSLKLFLKDYSEKIKTENIDSLWENYSRFRKRLQFIIEDKKADSLDFVELKSIVKENERPTKN
jgi:hypothetical protein